MFPTSIRALFAAGATPGEVRASVTEVFSPPRVAAMAERRPRYGSSPQGLWTCARGGGASLGISTSLKTVRGRSDSSPPAGPTY
eukprot:407035-Alexandrium_andersonii.AAC.1